MQEEALDGEVSSGTGPQVGGNVVLVAREPWV